MSSPDDEPSPYLTLINCSSGKPPAPAIEYIQLNDCTSSRTPNDEDENGFIGEYIDHSELQQVATYLELEEGDADNEENEYAAIHYYQSVLPLYGRCTGARARRMVATTVVALLALLLIALLIWRLYFITPAKLALHSGPQYCTGFKDKKSLSACRRSFVRNMTVEAFAVYREYAWGSPAVKPVSRQPAQYGSFAPLTGLTLVDSMSTLWTMGLSEQWRQGLQWITEELSFPSSFDGDQNSISSRAIIDDYLGGLLSAYALSGEAVLLNRSTELLLMIETVGAFDPFSGMLVSQIAPKKQRKVQNQSVVEKPDSINSLSGIGFQQPELLYLAKLIDDDDGDGSGHRLNSRLAAVKELMIYAGILYDGLYFSTVDVTKGSFQPKTEGRVVSLFEQSNQFHYNLLRSYIQRGRREASLLEMYRKAIEACFHVGLFNRMELNGLVYVREADLSAERYSRGMDESACQLGAILAIGSRELQAVNTTAAKLHMQLAVNITETCYQTANGTLTKLLPDSFRMNYTSLGRGSISPFLAESYLILWRLTGDVKYQERAWELTMAVYIHARTLTGGYTRLVGVDSFVSGVEDVQAEYFISGLFKYLYLTFSNDSTLPLDRWIFNNRGHPLPIFCPASKEKEEATFSMQKKLCIFEPQPCTDHQSINSLNGCRQAFVRNMTREAFGLYRRYAWGAAIVHPITRQPSSGFCTSYPGLSLINALSTLWTMGLKKEWAAAVNWVEKEFAYSAINGSIGSMETMTDYLGGLLSAYALSGDPVLLNRSAAVLETLLPAFHPITGLLVYKIKPSSGQLDVQWNYLSNVGFQQPELIYLSKLLPNHKAVARLPGILAKTRQTMEAAFRPFGLYMHVVNASSGEPVSSMSTLNNGAIDFYYNMLRSYVQLGREDAELLEMYAQAMSATVKAGMFKLMTSGGDGLLYVDSYDVIRRNSSLVMDRTACQLGAMLAIGARELKNVSTSAAELHLQLAVNITETCYQTASRTRTKLLPESFWADGTVNDNGHLVPYLAESYFILWRLTADSKYRERAWELTMAMYKHCRTTLGGISDLRSVDSLPAEKDNSQQWYLFSGTLNYLYLIFANKTDNDLFSLDEWIFNMRGHPLPVCGKNKRCNKVSTF